MHPLGRFVREACPVLIKEKMALMVRRRSEKMMRESEERDRLFREARSSWRSDMKDDDMLSDTDNHSNSSVSGDTPLSAEPAAARITASHVLDSYSSFVERGRSQSQTSSPDGDTGTGSSSFRGDTRRGSVASSMCDTPQDMRPDAADHSASSREDASRCGDSIGEQSNSKSNLAGEGRVDRNVSGVKLQYKGREGGVDTKSSADDSLNGMVDRDFDVSGCHDMEEEEDGDEEEADNMEEEDGDKEEAEVEDVEEETGAKADEESRSTESGDDSGNHGEQDIDMDENSVGEDEEERLEQASETDESDAHGTASDASNQGDQHSPTDFDDHVNGNMDDDFEGSTELEAAGAAALEEPSHGKQAIDLTSDLGKGKVDGDKEALEVDDNDSVVKCASEVKKRKQTEKVTSSVRATHARKHTHTRARQEA